MTFFGGKEFDYVCLDSKGYICASGKKTNMLKLARRLNYAVGKLYPVRYAKPDENRKALIKLGKKG